MAPSKNFEDAFPGGSQAGLRVAKRATPPFGHAMEVESVYQKLGSEALEPFASGEDPPPESIYVCSICGNTVVGHPPEKCPVCGASEEQFDEIR